MLLNGAMTSSNLKNDAEDAWQARYDAAVHQFGMALQELGDTNPWPDQPVLPKAMNYLMTELWDHYFSQTEIRGAFEEALSDMARYAAGEEVRP
jgi:hypothetical protein